MSRNSTGKYVMSILDPSNAHSKDKRRPHEHKDVDVFNIRGREAEFTLDEQGFQIIPFAPTSETNFDDKEDIEGQYYQDVVAHLKKV